MTGILPLSPADVFRRVLIQLELGKDPPATPWPVYALAEPTAPDNVISVYDTAGKQSSRAGWGALRGEMYGIQVRIRAANHLVGYPKANAIAAAMDSLMMHKTITVPGVSGVPTTTFRFGTVSRTSNVLALGFESATSKRVVFTVNALATLRVVT